MADTGAGISNLRHTTQSDNNGADPNPLGDRTSADLLSTLPDALLLQNADGRFTRYLGGAARDPILCPGELEAKTISDVWPAAAARGMDSAVRRVLKTRMSHTTSRMSGGEGFFVWKTTLIALNVRAGRSD